MRGWFDKKGEQSDVVVSTRVRLARNLSDTPFPANWNDETAKAVIEKIKAAAADTPHSFEFLNLDNAPDLNKQALVEEHVMSREMLSGKNKALLLSGDGCVSVMIGEEDDIRLQVIAPGLDLDGVYKTADALDDMLGETLDYAFDEQFGFLTRCPTNVGTGMRASVMLHLPALELAGRMNQLAGEVGKLGLTIRGLYGEGSDSKGSLYQLSNQITLGISEAQTLEKLKNITMQIIETERGMRKRLYERNPDSLSDTLWRALGTLKYARRLTSAECESLLSEVKLGADMGIITEADAHTLTKLMIASEPAHIALSAGENITPEARDLRRADMIRAALA
jgi:protein arginine kinase